MEKNTLRCYQDTYLKINVLLLANVFEIFRKTHLENYKLDPAHLYNTPGLAWQALLKTAAEYCEYEKRCKECEVCPQEVQTWAANRYRHAADGWKRYSRKLSVMLRLIISTWRNYKIPMKRAYAFSTWMQTIFTDGQWFRTYQDMDWSGRWEKTSPLKK